MKLEFQMENFQSLRLSNQELASPMVTPSQDGLTEDGLVEAPTLLHSLA